ncbi:MAG: molybdopterin oxidoreductase, membrane subunit, partial [Acidimicrobiaceae bacterium]
GYLLLTAAMVMLYANASEFITKGYHPSEDDLFAFRELFVTSFAPLYWFYFFGGLVLPIVIVAYKRTRTITGLVIASAFVVVAMFIERYFIVVAGMRVPLMSYEAASYAPTWIEWSIFAAGLALFSLLLTLFTKFFPILAIWEMKEEHAERTKAKSTERVGVVS